MYRYKTASSTSSDQIREIDYPQTKDQLVPDERYAYRPSEIVQRKLQSMLPGSSLPVSCLHHHRLVRR